MTRDEFASQVVAQTDRMYRIAWTMLRSDADCRDAMQETALKAWEKRATLRHDAYFATWLTRILINECRNVQRRRGRTVPLEEWAETSAPVPDVTLSIAVQRLPENLRLPLVMHAVEGMPYAEVAKALKLPQATITGRIHRAKLLLRKELAE